VFPTNDNPPPLSPVLIGGLIAQPLPPTLMQPILDAAFRAMMGRHEGLFERLSHLDNPTFLIDPIDLPLVFILDANAESPKLAVMRENKGEISATIRGPLLMLIKLLEGKVDGDALFFARGLVVEGDTEAVVALRNAVDDAEIDIAGDLIASLGPLARPAGFTHRLGARLYGRMARDLDLIRAAMGSSGRKRSSP
jgi:O2-independent ubiquinone biosynthesis accessory factor UbiT